MIFSKKIDYIFLTFPAIFAYFMTFLFEFNTEVIIYVFFLTRLIIDSPHFFLTFFPLSDRIKEGKINKVILYGIPIFSFLLTISLGLIDNYLMIFMVHMSFYHVIKQQIGWCCVIGMKNNIYPKNIKRSLELMMYGSYFSFLFSPSLSENLRDIFVIPTSYIKQEISFSILVISGLLSLYFMFRGVLNKEVKDQSPLILGTAIWFLLSFVVLKDLVYIFYAQIICHPLPYIFFVWNKVKDRSINLEKSFFKLIIFVLIISLAFTILLMFGVKYSDYFWIFIFGVMLTHYNYDAIIWKRKYGFNIKS